jgi:hypothetical protein
MKEEEEEGNKTKVRMYVKVSACCHAGKCNQFMKTMLSR